MRIAPFRHGPRYHARSGRDGWSCPHKAAGEWTRDFSSSALKAIAVVELLRAVGLIPPAAFNIEPILVPIAASGAVLLFAGAAIMRLRRGERATIVVDLLYLALAAFVASGRFGPWSFTG